ncbi:MAG: 5,6-dimethylbenzimidazole synthase [Pelagimonas sp.]|uniref:5,6-dimethylbenzimidazole synthase n=1 Tax=Pelagimonas sp. TaxID=2073170 RepID=UPI003D6C6040
MNFNEVQQQALFDLLTWRRDTRHFETTPVDDVTLAKLHQAMELAPSVGNARPWRVFNVSSLDKRGQVRAEFLKCNQQAEEKYEGPTRDAYKKLKLAGLDMAPVQLAVFTETAPEEGRGLGRQTMPETLAQSTSMAIFSLWLTARSCNLGVGMVSILDPRRMETLFDVPSSWRFNAYLCIGHPSFQDDTPLLHKVGWQENTSNTWEEV